MRRIFVGMVLSAMLLGGLLLGMGLLTASSGRTAARAASQPSPQHLAARPSSYRFESSYVYQSLPEMVATADAIVLGRVVAITPARFNQDSGAYWEQAGYTTLPYYELTVALQRPLLDTIGLGSRATITVLGGSPAGTDASAGVPIDNAEAAALNVGDEAVFVVARRAMAWRGGTPGQQATRPILRFQSAPELSMLIRRPDGAFASSDPDGRPIRLDQLIAQIAERPTGAH